MISTLARRGKTRRSCPRPFTLVPLAGVDGAQKRIAARFPARFKSVEILHITDVQYGHKCCNVARLTEFRDWVLLEPNRFVVFGGDMIDAASLGRIGSPYDNKDEPLHQVSEFCDLMMPFQHRVLGYVGGNHEHRGVRAGFGDIGTLIASRLNIPYSGGQQLIDVHFGDHDPFRIHLWHGGGSGSTAGSKMQTLARFMERGDSQLYLVGHLHEPMVRFFARPIRHKDGSIKMVKIGGAMSGSFLDYWGTYAEVANLTAAPLMMARVILEPNGHWELTLR